MLYCIELTGNNHFQVAKRATPSLAAGEVLVKTHAVALNPVDYKLADGSIPIEKPAVLGHELSGTVVSGNEKFKTDDPVVAYLPGPHTQSSGAFAEFIAIPEYYLCLKPQNLNLTTACAYPLTALTAYQCVTRLNPKANKKALVVGANGAVGLLIVQLLLYLQINVTALVRSDNAKQMLLSQTTLSQAQIMTDPDALNDQTFNYCFDLVGGKLKELCFAHAAFRGDIITIVEEQNSPLDLWDARKSPAFAKSLTVHFEFLGSEAYFGEPKDRALYAKQLEAVKNLIESGVFHYSNLEITNGLNVANVKFLLEQLKNRSTLANKLIVEF